MIITDLTTRLIRISAESWFSPRPIPVDHVPFWDFPFTTLHTSEGVEGYTMNYCPLGQGRASAYAVHDIFFHDLVGKNPLHHESIWQSLHTKQRHLYNIRETFWGDLDVALWDIKGKVAGMSIATMLGQYRTHVPTYATCPPQTIMTVADTAEQVCLKIKQGYQGVKLQLSGGSTLDIPLVCVKHVRWQDQIIR